MSTNLGVVITQELPSLNLKRDPPPATFEPWLRRGLTCVRRVGRCMPVGWGRWCVREMEHPSQRPGQAPSRRPTKNRRLVAPPKVGAVPSPDDLRNQRRPSKLQPIATAGDVKLKQILRHLAQLHGRMQM